MEEELNDRAKEMGRENACRVSTWIDQKIAPMVPRTLAAMGTSMWTDKKTTIQGAVEELYGPDWKQRNISNVVELLSNCEVMLIN